MKLLPSSGSAIVKYVNPSSAITVEKVSSFSVKKKTTKVKGMEGYGENILLSIQKKVIKIDTLLKSSSLLKKKDSESKRKVKEKEKFNEKERELESKKVPKVKGLELPSFPKLGLFSWIKNFIFNTILGFVLIRVIDYLPTLSKILPTVIKAADFVIDVGGKLLDGLVTFIDWGYKAYDATRGFVKNLFGQGGVKKFDELSSTLNKFLNLAIIAGMAVAGSGGGGRRGGGRRGGAGPGGGFRQNGGRGGRWQGLTYDKILREKGIDQTLKQSDNAIMKRYFQRFGRDKFIQRFGEEGLKRLPGGMQRGFLQRSARSAFMGIAGKGGAKTILGTVRPFLKRIPLPVVGALIDFGLSVALGENPGKAAFRAIGAGILGAAGAAVGSFVPFAGNIILGVAGGMLGDAIGGALYDFFFTGKKPKQGKVNKLAGGGSPIIKGGKRPISRTLKRKKVKRSISIIPTKIKPGKSSGGQDKVQNLFPNPENPPNKAWWDPLGVFTGKNGQQQKTQKAKNKVANSQEFLIKSNNILGAGDLGPISTITLKSVLGDRPTKLDFLRAAQGLNSFIGNLFDSGTLGFAGGGEVNAKRYFQGEDFTNVIAKSIEDSLSKKINQTITNLERELSLKSVVDSIQGRDESGGGGGGGGGFGGFDDSTHGTPGPPVQVTPGFNAGKGDKTRRIFLHWTASNYTTPFNNYHTTFLGDGKAIRNRPYDVDGTEHTGGANRNSVGLSIAAMGGKGIGPDRFGSFPPTTAQVSAMALEAARLALGWGWDESTIDKNVMTHGEWERYATSRGILRGAPQRWDLDKLRQSDPMNSGGDRLRKMIKLYFRKLKSGATVDSSGRMISSSTGSSFAQMSLETAEELSGNGIIGGVNLNESEMNLLQRLVLAEAGGEGKTGMALVARSVLNRVGLIQSGKATKGTFNALSGTIEGVIMGPKQYSPVGNKTINLPRSQSQMNLAKQAIVLAQNLNQLKQILQSEGIDGSNIKKLLASTGFRTGYAFDDQSQNVNVVKYKNHYFNTAGNKALIVPSTQVSQYSGERIGFLGGGGRAMFGETGNVSNEKGWVHGHFQGSDPRSVVRDTSLVVRSLLRQGSPVYLNPGLDLIPGKNYSDSEIINFVEGARRAHTHSGTGSSIDVFVKKGTRVPVPLTNIGPSGPGFGGYGRGGLAGYIQGTRTWIGHLDPSSSPRSGRSSEGSGSKFHGGSGFVSTDKFTLTLHKGEMYRVVDADSVDAVGADFIQDIIDIENKTQLIARAPSIIEKLKAISGYTDYENPEPEIEYVYVQVPVESARSIESNSADLISLGSGIRGIDNNKYEKYEMLEML